MLILSTSSRQNTGLLLLALRQTLDDFARHSADVSAAMPADFGFITNPAQRDADEIAVHGARHGTRQRGLAHTRRSHQAQDGSLDLLHQCLDRQIFQDALLGLFQAVVVFIQNGLGLVDIDLVLGFFEPGQRQ